MTAKQTESERLVKLEVKVENIENLVKKMDGKLDDILKEQGSVRLQTVTRKELEIELEALRIDIKDTKKKNAFQVFITGSLAALFGSILTLLISYFIQTIGK